MGTTFTAADIAADDPWVITNADGAVVESLPACDAYLALFDYNDLHNGGYTAVPACLDHPGETDEACPLH